MMLVRGNAKTDGPVHMPDKWLTAQLILTTLTPFKAFAPITTAFAIAFLRTTSTIGSFGRTKAFDRAAAKEQAAGEAKAK